jgi:predicted CxxxxCH...CXXCH cytochrome family protein
MVRVDFAHPGVPVSYAANSSRLTRAALLAAVALVAACGSSRKLEEGADFCVRCHGGNGNAAPPRATTGATSPSDPHVGAHQAHLVAGRLRGPVECGECHAVPTTVAHVDGVAALTWGTTATSIATKESASPSYAAGRCSSTFCHGATLAGGTYGGSNKAPLWTGGAAEAACGTCHGAPPTNHDPSFTIDGAGGTTRCNDCHSATVNADGTIKFAADGSSVHMNGVRDAPSGGACTSCHGTSAAGNAAPPKAAKTTPGDLTTSNPGVGAHQAHVGCVPPGGTPIAGQPACTLRAPIACNECHVVPGDFAHQVGTPPAPVTFGGGVAGALALKDGASPAYTGGSCNGTYCHGATMAHGGSNKSPLWAGNTTVQDAQAACGTCHGDPPPSHANANAILGTSIDFSICGGCHTGSINFDKTIKFTGAASARTSLHLNGVHEAQSLGCDTCHGTGPTTAGHVVHGALLETTYGSTSTLSTVATSADPTDPTNASYKYGCGLCHPTNGAKHGDGTVDVDLDPATAPVGSLKAKNGAGAAYSGPIGSKSGTCSNVYCHSSGQGTPTFVTTPAWNAAPGSLGCAGCHKNPPSYANGGAGTATANSHLGRYDDGTNVYAVGHFMGLPADIHQGSAHGGGTGTQFAGDAAAPITCQSCHYKTVDPANSGPSGFYYLDTTGTYLVDGFAGDIAIACTSCHTGTTGTKPVKSGAVKPLLHVNGVRDVTFDTRTGFASATGTLTLPAIDTPTRPYWFSGAASSTITDALTGYAPLANLVTHIGLETNPSTGTTLSMDLSEAVWTPATRSCSNVSCHINRLTTGFDASFPTSYPHLNTETWGNYGVAGAKLNSATGGACSVCHRSSDAP